jgi:acetoin utilization deacetylase AcuC-like enzyme
MTVRTHLISPIAPDYLSGDTGAYSYGLGHPMKPQRMRITHELVMAYGMLEKLHVLVSLHLCEPQLET